LQAICRPCVAVGFGVWQRVAGTVFKDVIVADSLEEAEILLSDRRLKTRDLLRLWNAPSSRRADKVAARAILETATSLSAEALSASGRALDRTTEEYQSKIDAINDAVSAANRTALEALSSVATVLSFVAEFNGTLATCSNASNEVASKLLEALDKAAEALNQAEIAKDRANQSLSIAKAGKYAASCDTTAEVQHEMSLLRHDFKAALAFLILAGFIVTLFCAVYVIRVERLVRN
jgi:chromosome segregation ATPase